MTNLTLAELVAKVHILEEAVNNLPSTDWYMFFVSLSGLLIVIAIAWISYSLEKKHERKLIVESKLGEIPKYCHDCSPQFHEIVKQVFIIENQVNEGKVIDFSPMNDILDVSFASLLKAYRIDVIHNINIDFLFDLANAYGYHKNVITHLLSEITKTNPQDRSLRMKDKYSGEEFFIALKYDEERHEKAKCDMRAARCCIESIELVGNTYLKDLEVDCVSALRGKKERKTMNEIYTEERLSLEPSTLVDADCPDLIVKEIFTPVKFERL